MDMYLWDCYCAICGRNLNAISRIGSHQQIALSIRRELVRKRLEGLPLTCDLSAYEHFDDEPWDWDWDWEIQSYDPQLVSRESLAWMADIACLGYNPDAPGEKKCFLAEADPFENYFELTLRPGDDENQPMDTTVVCWKVFPRTLLTPTLTSRSYYPPEPDKTAVFPFHGACYSMLSRVQYATKHHLPVDPTLLYDTMTALLPRGLGCFEAVRLDIDYGPLPERPGGCEPFVGEELGVTSPFDVAAFYNHLRERLASGYFQPSPPVAVLGLASPDSDDPFSRLSNELIREIALVVPYDSLLSLRGTSRPFYHDTRSNGFWKSRIANDMPWLWDLEASLGTWIDQIDYMKLYAWLEVVTIPKLGIERPFLAIANRRRIWQCCLEILSHSQDVLGLEQAFATGEPVASTLRT